ncbi:MAG TPA: hypothetical protein VJ323_03975 [Bryobacteraceae bacterium]|nr:hypothetical protein [Bryobacteraceae bacterium]
MKEENRGAGLDRSLVALLISYTLASLAHFVHNAEFLNEYPNMPDWLSQAEVYGSWLAVVGLGLAGYLLYQWRFRSLGLITIAFYGVCGLDGLTHYALAPIGAHTQTMHSTILLEAITGLVLTIKAVSMWNKQHKGPMPANR